MPQFPRPLSRILTWVSATVLLVTAMVLGMFAAMHLAAAILILALFLWWGGLVAHVAWASLRVHTVPHIEDQRLVQRDAAGREHVAIDLGRPFDCSSCTSTERLPSTAFGRDGSACGSSSHIVMSTSCVTSSECRGHHNLHRPRNGRLDVCALLQVSVAADIAGSLVRTGTSPPLC